MVAISLLVAESAQVGFRLPVVTNLLSFIVYEKKQLNKVGLPGAKVRAVVRPPSVSPLSAYRPFFTRAAVIAVLGVAPLALIAASKSWPEIHAPMPTELSGSDGDPTFGAYFASAAW